MREGLERFCFSNEWGENGGFLDGFWWEKSSGWKESVLDEVINNPL